MRYLTLIICIGFLTSCSKKKEYYNFHLGTSSSQMELHDNIDIIKEEFLDKAMEVWKTMDEKESKWFYYSKTKSIDGMDGKVADDGRELTAQSTSSSGKWRFFKNREGKSGIEVIGENGPFAIMVSDEELSEASIRSFLKDDLEHMELILEN